MNTRHISIGTLDQRRDIKLRIISAGRKYLNLFRFHLAQAFTRRGTGMVLVKKYEKIQNNINLLLSDARVSEFTSLDHLEQDDTDIYQLTKKKK